MIRASTLLTGVLFAQFALAGSAPAPDSSESLLRELESRYEQCMEAARHGDLPAYWQLRTDASRDRPPGLDATRIRLLADLLPPLSTLEFVRLDASEKTARALYRWRGTDVAQYSVVVYRRERGGWRLDDIGVRRSASSGVAPRDATRHATQPRALPVVDSASGALETGLPSESEAILRAWERGGPDPSRRLEAPRL